MECLLNESINTFNSRMNTVSGISTRSSDETWRKNQFRKSRVWKDFCSCLISARGHQCERCHSPENLVVHHRDPLNYTDLKAEKFAVLCNSCHLIIESQCKSEEQMLLHYENHKWHTFYPYNTDPVKWQSGTGTQLKWKRERQAVINRPEYTPSKKQAKEALDFMKAHPELFV